MSNAKKLDTRKLTQLSLLIAIEAIFCFVPWLGSIPIGPIVATLSHLPVIIAGMMLGVSGGAILGFTFGLFSFIVNSQGQMGSFLFSPLAPMGNGLSLLICFLPRILLGIAAALLFKWLSKRDKTHSWSYIVTGLGATFVHTGLVLLGGALFFGETLTAGGKVLLSIIWTTILTNGIPEAVIAALVALGVGQVLRVTLRRRG